MPKKGGKKTSGGMTQPKRNFNPKAADTFMDSVTLNFDSTKGAYTNAVIYDGADNTKTFATVEDAKKAKVKSLLVVIEATHDGKTENYTEYFGDKMEKSTPTWTTPHNKPVLTHHNSYNGDPIGRVVKAEFGESLTHPGAKTIFLSMNVTDPDAIEKFLDGRYSTVSIGARVKELTCQICGREILKDGFCGHWAGDKYKKTKKNEETGKDEETMEMCYWSIGECTYYEVSVVNTPADKKQTGPLQMSKTTESDDDNEDDENSDDGENNTDSAEMNALKKAIDGMDTDDNDDEENNDDDEDSGEDDNEDDDDNSDTDDDDGDDEDGTDGEEEDSAKIQRLEKEVNDLKAEKELLEITNGTLQEDNKKLDKENKKLEKQTETAKNQYKTLSSQTLKLGRQYRDTLQKTIKALGRKEIDDAVYAEKSLIEIKKEFEEAVKHTATLIPQSQSPGFANNNADGVNSDSDGANSNKVSKKEKRTLQDYTNEIIAKNKTEE